MLREENGGDNKRNSIEVGDSSSFRSVGRIKEGEIPPVGRNDSE